MKLPGLISRARAALARAIAPKGPRGRNAFAAAFSSRLTGDWIFAGTRSANQETLQDLRIMRDRSRDLVRNSPFIRHYHQLIAENVVGPHGVTLQAKNVLQDGTALHTRANTQIETAWRDWCRPENCDIARRHSLPEMLRLAVSAGWAMDGEILIVMHEGAQRNGWNFSLQLLDPDLLNEKLNQAATATTNAIHQGVEVDQYGAPVAYHLFTRHPNEAGYDRELIRVPAERVIHDFIALRPGQARGVPWTSAVIQQIKMLDGYHEAELVAARTASSSMGAVEIADPEKATAFDATAGARELPAEVEPGTLLRLNPGEKLALWDPQHPTQAFSEFTRVTLHAIAAGLGVSYGTLTGDLSQANYSSMRVGMLAERDHWRVLQQALVVHVLDRVYRRWINLALLADKLPGLGFDGARWLNVKWQPRGFDWIDPLVDVKGDIIEVAAGTKTLTEMAAERGRDLEEIIEERARELKLLEKHGVTSTLATNPSVSTDSNATSDASNGAAGRWVTPLRPARSA